MAWQGLKHCLGWDYAAQSKHLLMVKYQWEQVMASILEAMAQKQVELTKWQSLVGQLWSLVQGMSSSLGKCSLVLQTALTCVEANRV
jgi:hypothetical protein